MVLAAPCAASACVSLSSVKSFGGSAGEVSYNESATGTVPSINGTLTIDMNLNATNLKIALGHKVRSRIPWFGMFTGKATGGNFLVNDSEAYQPGDSGSDSAGGPPNLKLPGMELTAVLFDLKHCKYAFEVSAGEYVNYSGPAGAAPPDGYVTFFATSPKRKIPSSLKLKGSASLPMIPGGCNGGSDLDVSACYSLDGDWANDFKMLRLCGSVSAGICQPDTTPQGLADISWNLKPKFKS